MCQNCCCLFTSHQYLQCTQQQPGITKAQAENVCTGSYQLPYFPTDNAHLTYNAHPKLFYIPFEVQITRT